MTEGKSIKEKIRNREEVLTLRVGIEMDRSVIEAALKKRDYDMLYVEGQHTAFTETQLVNFCNMADEIGIPVKLRIPHWKHTYLIGRYFDFGPLSILVPQVEHESTVEEAIAYSYYPPKGIRSTGGVGRYGVKSFTGPSSSREYANWWNDQVVISIMIESIDAIANARKFVKPGLDYLAFGPGDMQFSLDLNPEFPIRTPDECMKYVADQISDEIPLGMAVPTLPEERDRYREMGVVVFQESLLPHSRLPHPSR